MIELIHTESRLVFGCGNPLFGDDGCGPEVIADLEAHHPMPDDTAFLDVGTSIRDFLFDIMLLKQKPMQIVIVDSARHPDRRPGEVFEISLDEIDPKKMGDFSLHQFPTTNMLKELKTDTDMDIRVLVGQIQTIPDRVAPGLSSAMTKAVKKASCRILEIIGKELS